MNASNLRGATVAVIVENKFIPEEIEAYRSGFRLLGAQVDFVSRIWYGDFKPERTTFYSDIDPLDDQPWETPHSLVVDRDISTVRPQDYAAVIMAANYTSVRLRYSDLPANVVEFDPWQHVKSPPVVKFFADAMEHRDLVKGALCHGLWILTPNPRLLRDRRVICHSVVMADVLNCGARIVLTPDRVVVDGDLVTAFSKHEVVPFIQAIAQQVAALKR